MHAGSPRVAHKVGLFLTVTLTVVASGGATRAQFAPPSRTTFLSCLVIETPASPSASLLAPVAAGSAPAGRVERLRQLVLGASSCTLRPSVDDDLQFANVAGPAHARGGSFDDMRKSLLAKTGSVGPLLDHSSETNSAPAFELGFGSQAARTMPLALNALHDNETPILRASMPGPPQSQSWAGLNGANSVFGPGGAPQALNSGLTPGAAPTVTPALSPPPQPFSSRILIPSGLDGGSANP